MINALKYLQKYDQAIKHCQKALALEPNYASALSNLGNIYLTQENYPKAIEQYQKAIKIQPNYPDFNYNLGTAHARLGEYKKALPFLNKAIEIDPNHQEAHAQLPVCGFPYSNKSHHSLNGLGRG